MAALAPPLRISELTGRGNVDPLVASTLAIP